MLCFVRQKRAAEKIHVWFLTLKEPSCQVHESPVIHGLEFLYERGAEVRGVCDEGKGKAEGKPGAFHD
ncbi:MAG: hypothetical protein A2036_01150 [Omnitrophica bacterium GWA2_50_21]|nr:MAG: hypothetical protein A2036_01150 [Omnitrophica bacterium GWA2_50_21]